MGKDIDRDLFILELDNSIYDVRTIHDFLVEKGKKNKKTDDIKKHLLLAVERMQESKQLIRRLWSELGAHEITCKMPKGMSAVDMLKELQRLQTENKRLRDGI